MLPKPFGILILPLICAAAQQAGQRPAVRSGVELIAVDVQVVRGNGEPIGGLQPSDFEVRIDGKSRRVVSVDFVRYVTSATPGPPSSQPPPVAAPEAKPPRRIFLIAVDEGSFTSITALVAMQAAGRFIDQLGPDDLVGLYGYPTGSVHVDPTTDHAQSKRALSAIHGLYEPPQSTFHLSLPEIIDINANDPMVFARVVARECRGEPACPPAIQGEASALAAYLEMRIAQSLGGLRELIHGIAAIPDRKTLVLVSGGLIANDRVGGRPDATGLTLAVGAEALLANLNLYVLHMDSRFMENVRDPVLDHAPQAFRDQVASGSGLEMIAGAGGGTMVRVYTDNLESAFTRVIRETSAHYLLGVSVDDTDRNGKVHNIAVKLKRRGATLRSRTVVLIPRPGDVRAAPEADNVEDLLPEPTQPPIVRPGVRTPSLPAILKSAAAYLDAYEQQAAGIVSEETYLQKSPEPDPETKAVSRELRSDMLIVPDATVGWLGFRDVFEADGQTVHDRSERLVQLFMHPVADRMNQARRIVLESSRYNLRRDIVRTINMPMMSLRFLRLVDQHRSKFTLEGIQAVDGTPAALVRFEEKAEPRMIQSADEAPARGAYWIEPATGRVLKTELLFDTKIEKTRLRVRVAVGYANQPQLGTWVPVTMDEEYRIGRGTLAVEGHATYANFRRFTVQTKEIIK